MNHSSPHPCLRWPLDIRIEHIEDAHVLLIRCPLGISSEPLFLQSWVSPILSCFDGSLSISEIIQKVQPYGVEAHIVQELVRLLDEKYYLLNDRFIQLDQETRAQFSQRTSRSAALAGHSYPNEPVPLAQLIDTYLTQEAIPSPGSKKELAVFIAPHIDYRRGGPCYGKGYQLLSQHEQDLYILLGTAHQYSPLLFHLTRKHFESPLGTVPCDEEFVSQVARLHGWARSFQDEILHKQEHSLELQIPFLKRVNPKATIVPILVGGFHSFVQSGKEPVDHEEYQSLVGSLVETLQERKRLNQRICLIAGVDMAHVGKSFGDKDPLTPSYLELIRHRDEEYLQAIESQDKQRLFSHIGEDKDARRMCGFPTLYTILDILDRLQIRCTTTRFSYEQAADYQSDCAVTFASMGMFHQEKNS